MTTLSATSNTGINIALDSNSNNYTLYPGDPSVWGNLQPAGFVEYTVFSPAAGTFGVQLYYSTTESGAGSNLWVNGIQQTAASLPSTGSWNTFQLSDPATITLPAGQSVIRIAAQAAFQAYNLEGVLFAPTSTSSTPTPPPNPTPSGPVTVVSSSGSTGFDITQDSNSNAYTLYLGNPSLWGDLQPGGYVEYTISASAGSYALQLYYSTTLAGGANVLVGGLQQQAVNLPSTGSWGSFQMSTPVTLNISSGVSVIRIAAQSSFEPFNLEGLSLNPINVGGSGPVTGNYPLAGVQFYVSPYSEAALNINASCSAFYPGSSGLIAKIANQPQGVWFGDWNVNVQSDAANVVKAAAALSQTPIMVAYNIPIRDCAGYSGGGAISAGAYQTWIQGLANGIGGAKAVMVLEPDALSQLYNSSCLNQTEQAERLSLLNYAVSTFKQSAPNTSVYIDAGHDGAVAVADMAQRLQNAGVASAAGFALNTSNYDSTVANTTYGQQISALIGQKHFVIDTSRNGLGPTSDNQWCNPPNRGLGSPSQGFGSGLVDGFVWVQNPGTSDGTCNGGPPAGTFFVQQACTLAHNAIF